MKNTGTNLITKVMNEYVMYGGPVVQRHVVHADLTDRGFDAKAIDYITFSKQAVEAPEDPEAHLAMFRQIQAMGL